MQSTKSADFRTQNYLTDAVGTYFINVFVNFSNVSVSINDLSGRAV